MDIEQTQEAPVSPSEGVEQVDPGKGTPDAPEGSEAPSEGQNEGLASLPKWAQDEIASVRAEAANYRTKLRDAEKALKEAKTPEDFEKAVADFAKKNAELERSLLIKTVAGDLPEEIQGYLKGETKEDLEKEVATFRALLAKDSKPKAPKPPSNPGGGNDPSAPDDPYANMSPQEIAAALTKGKYSIL